MAGKGAGFTWLYLVAAGYVIWRYRRQDLEKEDWWLLGMGVCGPGNLLATLLFFDLLVVQIRFLVVDHPGY